MMKRGSFFSLMMAVMVIIMLSTAFIVASVHKSHLGNPSQPAIRALFVEKELDAFELQLEASGSEAVLALQSFPWDQWALTKCEASYKDSDTYVLVRNKDCAREIRQLYTYYLTYFANEHLFDIKANKFRYTKSKDSSISLRLENQHVFEDEMLLPVLKRNGDGYDVAYTTRVPLEFTVVAHGSSPQDSNLNWKYTDKITDYSDVVHVINAKREVSFLVDLYGQPEFAYQLLEKHDKISEPIEKVISSTINQALFINAFVHPKNEVINTVAPLVVINVQSVVDALGLQGEAVYADGGIYVYFPIAKLAYFYAII
ncbi:MAG: hypothetical protein ACI8Y7_000915 [Candidatus Woesearchaeota archaeon]|jgi:hypothetical protein